MIIKVSGGDGEGIDFDTESPLLGADFDGLLGVLAKGGVPAHVQRRVAYGYRGRPGLAVRILEQLSREQEDRDGDTLLLLLAARLQAGADGVDVVQRMGSVESDMFDILKGFVSLRKRSYDGAMFLFGKARFALGVQICNYYLGNVSEARRSENKVVRGYCVLSEGGGAEAARLFCEAGKKDLAFGLGVGTEYDDKENMDVRVRIVSELVSAGEFDRACGMLSGMPQSAETWYLRGKMDHVRGDTEGARRHYVESLVHDKGFFKSEYNLQRIVQDRMGDSGYRTPEFCDFKAYLKLKNKEADVDVSGCSEEFRDVVAVMSGEGQHRPDMLWRKYMRLVGNPWIDGFVVMNNIGYSLCRDMRPFEDVCEATEGSDRFLVGPIGVSGEERRSWAEGECVGDRRARGEEYLRKALEECPDEYKEVIRYNIGYVTEDRAMLGSVGLKEAKLLLSVGGDGIASIPNELELIGLYHMGRREFRLAKKIFQKLDTVYSSIVLGNMYIRSFHKDKDVSAVGKAMKAFSRGLRSYYCGNGVGICLALRGRTGEAIEVFESVAVDWAGGYVNLGNALVLCGRYREAMDAFAKVSSMRYAQEMLGRLCRVVDKVDGYRLCMDAGVGGVRERLFELLVLQGRLAEAKQLEVSDARLVRMYDEKACEEARQREEMKEYRKRARRVD